MTLAPAFRDRAQRYGDHALGRLLRLPAPTTGFTTRRDVRIPMRDGVELLADHFTPTGTGPIRGTVLVRTPYGRAFPASVIYARIYAARGYHVVVQSVRGTFGSAGVFDPMVQEVDDGADTVAWLREQPWFTGRFATLGPSYLGLTQWALHRNPPPELVASVVIVGLHDLSEAAWGTGAFSLHDYLGWSEAVAHQEDGGRLRGMLRYLSAARRLERATGSLPLGETGRKLIGAGAPWYESWLEHPDRDDPFWEQFRFADALDRVTVPTLLVGGWQDIFLGQTLEQYRRLRQRGTDVALTIGPWTHAQIGWSGAGRVARDSLNWLDRHLSGHSRQHPGDPVRVWVNGSQWAKLPAWPPPTDDLVLYPARDGSLTQEPTQSRPSDFHYDPTDPTPTVGGPMLFPQGGYRDDTELADRGDVLSFTGEALAYDRFLMGSPVVELAHSADSPHVDVFVRVSEVDADGRSRNVSDGYRRLSATPTPHVVKVELDASAHRFRAGSRIRLLVAGGSHPRFARNPGTGEPPLTARRLVGATHSVHHDPRTRVTLPIDERRGSADRAAHHIGEPE